MKGRLKRNFHFLKDSSHYCSGNFLCDSFGDCLGYCPDDSCETSCDTPCDFQLLWRNSICGKLGTKRTIKTSKRLLCIEELKLWRI